MDVNDDAVEADDTAERDRIVAGVYRDYLTKVLEVKAVLTWGATDKNSWLNTRNIRKVHPDRVQRPLPFDPDYAPAPAFFAMRESFDKAKKR
jgi:endo-1,4-beta-xylanase